MFKWLSEFFLFSRNYVVFAILLALSLFLISINDNPQVRGLQVVGLITTSYLESGVNAVVGYFELSSANKRLEEQNGRLIDLLARSRRSLNENRQLRSLLKLKQQGENRLTAADVIGRTLEGGRYLITLDAGSRLGVKVGDPVISGSGLVGNVMATSDNFSVVRTLLDNDSRISARLENASADGIVTAGEYGLLAMKNVPRRFEVKPGDVIETSTLSTVVPPGIIIGLVREATDVSGTIFKRIFVQPAVNYSSLSEVFVMDYRPPSEVSMLLSKAMKAR